MFKLSALAVAMLLATCVFAAQHQDKSIHHAAMHAEHWTNHHANPPSRSRHHYPKRRHKDKSVHHAAMHTEHWLNHHLSAPHKGGG